MKGDEPIAKGDPPKVEPKVDPKQEPPVIAKKPPVPRNLPKPVESITEKDLSRRIFKYASDDAPMRYPTWARDGKSFYVLTQRGRLERINAETGEVEKKHPLSEKGAADATYLYWLHDNNKLFKISRDFKVERRNVLPQPISQFAYSGGGLMAVNGSDIWIIDPNTLTVRSKIGPLGSEWLGGSAVTPLGGALSIELHLLDLRLGLPIKATIVGGPKKPMVGLRNVGYSPDGKYLVVQAADNVLHRLRVNGPQLIHEQSMQPIVTDELQIQFSPDSKYVAFTYTNQFYARNVKKTEVYRLDTWAAPAFTIPDPLRYVAFDTKGGLYADAARGEIRYYPDPAKTPTAFESCKVQLSPTWLATPPQGPGCLVIALGKSVWIELAGK